MKTWTEAFRDGVVSGSVSSAVSTAVLSTCGHAEESKPFAPTNATSHWIWGDCAADHEDASWRHTGIGYAIHHVSATLWAVFYEKWFGRLAERGEVMPALASGAVVAGLACFVDYTLTPRRLTPGFEKRLSMRSLMLVYAGFGAALPVRGLFASRRRGVRKLA